MGAETLVIPREQFNHGLTRERARKVLGTQIVVMMTPDAYFLDPESVKKLVAAVEHDKVGIAYARQIPHDSAGILEGFARGFNYPPESHQRTMADLSLYGVFTYFCSSTCAVYSNRAMDEIGGFRSVLTAEDTLAGALLLRRGYRIAYVADAVVKHSHGYNLTRSFGAISTLATCAGSIANCWPPMNQTRTAAGALYRNCWASFIVALRI